AAALSQSLCAELAYQDPATREHATRLLSGSFKAAIAIGPAFSLRGLLQLDKGNLKGALMDAQKALELSPADGRAYYVRGRARLQRGEAGALADLEKAAALSKNADGLILHWLAAALAEAGRHAEALAMQRRAAELRPEDAEVIDQLRSLERTPDQAGS